MPSPARLALPFLPILLAGGCVAAPEPAPPTATPVVAPPPVASAPAPNWEDRGLSPGGWRYADGTATFGGGLATLSCRRDARAVVLTVSGSAGPATIRTTSATRQVVLATDGSVRLAANDPLLDAMAFSRGRFTVEPAGTAPLVLPSHAEVGRVIEDCRG